jgi:hypothetical protein
MGEFAKKLHRRMASKAHTLPTKEPKRRPNELLPGGIKDIPTLIKEPKPYTQGQPDGCRIQFSGRFLGALDNAKNRNETERRRATVAGSRWPRQT